MNTKQPMSERLSQVALLLPAAVGAGVILRALGVYLAQDPVASLIVGIMGVGFGAGVAELWLRHRRAFALGREVDALPRKASESVLDKASAPLRAFLRARIEHAPAPALGENLTPYLVGFMVMLGLLGTLLGLFETLHGAGQALTASADVNALRSGLSGPMRGLTRSFGCSAAGVSASAMLGLAAVFVRRAEAAAWARAQSYATGPLRELSPMRRQLDSFQQLAQQGESLPKAAVSLEQASVHLGQLAERWESAHRATLEAQQKSAQELMERMRTELARSSADAGRVLSESVTPMLKQVVAQTGDALTKQMASTREALDRDLAARRDADAGMRTQLREELATTREQAQAQLATLAGAAQSLASQLDHEAQERRREAGRLLSDLTGKLDAAASERSLQGQRELDALSILGERLSERSEQREEALASRWSELVDRIQADLAQLVESIGSDVSTRAERDRALAEGVERSLDTLRRGAQGLQELVDKQDHTVQELLSRSTQQMEALGKSAQDGAREALTALVELGEQQTQRAVESEASAREAAREALSALVKLGEAQAQRAVEGETSAREAAREALATLVKLGEEQAQRAATADSTVQANTQKILEQLVREGEEHALRVMQLGEDHASRFVQLETLLQGTQTQHANSLAGELTGHAEKLSKGLEATTALVQEAATVLRASSVEMGAVAGLFHQSVERQREAAQAWMESLGELEGAVERAGRGAAADALGDQLASTQEVFARQLQFQRELFEQLRTLRGASIPPAAPKGEHDVSA
ncbi:MAG: hypothetical protein QM778_03855 [Myxococcales bacterium]